MKCFLSFSSHLTRACFQWQEAKNGSLRLIHHMSFQRIMPSHMSKPLELVLSRLYNELAILGRKLDLAITLSVISLF